eukprot:1047277-Pleurochrysis_carterae.AAC.2
MRLWTGEMMILFEDTDKAMGSSSSITTKNARKAQKCKGEQKVQRTECGKGAREAKWEGSRTPHVEDESPR